MRKIWFVLLILTLVASACQPQSTAPQITVVDVWGPSSPEVASTAAFYMVIKNAGNETDTLISVESDACGIAELHESHMMDNSTMDMGPVEGGIEIPARGSVELKAGGLHVMCMDKMANFATGDMYTLTLTFEKSGSMMVQALVKEQ